MSDGESWASNSETIGYKMSSNDGVVYKSWHRLQFMLLLGNRKHVGRMY